MSNVAFTSAEQEQAYIRQRATQYGLDPGAVLAVAAHEGVTLPAEVGDSGTSFGPWQLHAGGALPSSIWSQGPAYAQQWANSPAGIDYALAGIRRSVGGATTGLAEIVAQVLNFERPAQPQPEIAAAEQTYQAGTGPAAGGVSGPSIQGLAVAQGGTQQTSGFSNTAGSLMSATSSSGVPPGFPTPNTPVTSWTSQQLQTVENALINGNISAAQVNSIYPGANVHGSSLNPFADVGAAIESVWGGVQGWLLRVLEMGGGLALVGIGLYGVFTALTKTELAGVAKTLAGAPGAVLPSGGGSSPSSGDERAQRAAASAQRAERAEQRREETHQVRVEHARARVKTEGARATELRTRTRHRARPRKLQEHEVRRAYVQGATDQARRG